MKKILILLSLIMLNNNSMDNRNLENQESFIPKKNNLILSHINKIKKTIFSKLRILPQKLKIALLKYYDGSIERNFNDIEPSENEKLIYSFITILGDVISASSREQTNESLAINWISGLFDISIEESQTYISMFDFMVLEYLIFAVKENA